MAPRSPARRLRAATLPAPLDMGPGRPNLMGPAQAGFRGPETAPAAPYGVLPCGWRPAAPYRPEDERLAIGLRRARCATSLYLPIACPGRSRWPQWARWLAPVFRPGWAA
jgi:hypothetical protein